MIELQDSDDDELVQDSVQPSAPIWQFLFSLLLWQSVFRISNATLTTLLSLLLVLLEMLFSVLHW